VGASSSGGSTSSLFGGSSSALPPFSPPLLNTVSSSKEEDDSSGSEEDGNMFGSKTPKAKVQRVILIPFLLFFSHFLSILFGELRADLCVCVPVSSRTIAFGPVIWRRKANTTQRTGRAGSC
jgi:hypothetical protein